MTTASRAYPELIRLPGRTRGRIRQLHLLTASLTDDSEFGINHVAILTRHPGPPGGAGRRAAERMP
jgi:hypothetical protein